MSRHRIRRFVLEVVFLAAAAAVVTAGDLRPIAVIVVMALAWIVVALFEWASWLDEPHYGRGLPPRYYVPQVALPPPRPVEQPGDRPPRSRDEAPTRIGSPAQWTAGPGDWPLLVPPVAGEDTEIAFPADLPAEPLPEFPPEIEPVLEPEPEPAASEVAVEPEPFSEAPSEPVVEEDAEPVEDADAYAPVEDADAGPLPEPAAASRARVARHHLDPLAGGRRRRLWRRAAKDGATVEVPDGPPGGRALPSRAPAERRGGNP